MSLHNNLFGLNPHMKQLTKITPHTVPHLVIDLGTKALGDCLARIAVIPELFNEAPQVLRAHVLAPKYLVEFASRALALYPITVHAKEDRLPEWLNGAPLFTFDSADLTTLRMGLIEHAYILLTQQLPRKRLLYPQVAPSFGERIGQSYIAACIDFTSMVRTFPLKVFNEILDSVRCPIILFGNSANVPFTTQLNITHPNLIDMRNLTTIDEAHADITHARAFIGVDNGLIHLAGYTSTPIVAGYTSVSPATRIPPRLNGKAAVVEPDPTCRYCQNETHFNYGHDYRNCAIAYPKCVTSLTTDKWLKGLKDVGCADLLI